MKVTVRCFASVRELFGRASFVVELPAGATLEALESVLTEQNADFARLQVACAVNREYARIDRVLEDGDEVAFIPPISGGAPGSELFRFDLSDGALDPRSLEAEVRTDRDGAVVTFAGVARDHSEGRRVTELAYEAYEEMAGKVMVGLFEAAAERFAITRARVAHRLGTVPIGEAAVLVVVSAAHRAAAFDACRFLMDRIKAEVPIFKKERMAGDGGERWVGDLPSGRPGDGPARL